MSQIPSCRCCERKPMTPFTRADKERRFQPSGVGSLESVLPWSRKVERANPAPRPIGEPYPVILFYKYVEISDADVCAAEQRALCSSLGLKGRILIASEGINGTLAGPAKGVDGYVAA